MRRGTAHGHEPREHAGHGMRPFKALISFEDARRIAMDLVRPMERKETVALIEAAGRVAAEDVRSRIDVPLADRAAMDGYAVVARDTAHAQKSRPTELRQLEVLHADTIPRKRVTTGTCTEVATGSTLPAGANAVVRVEDTEHDGKVVKILAAVHAGQHVVTRGADIRRGSIVVRTKAWRTPRRGGALAAIGMAGARAYAQPRVSILTTGGEIVPPVKPSRAGQTQNITS